jgi:hypothetical protein
MKIKASDLRKIIREETLLIDRQNQTKREVKKVWLHLRESGYTDFEIIDGFLTGNENFKKEFLFEAAEESFIDNVGSAFRSFIPDEEESEGYFSRLQGGFTDVIKGKISEKVIDVVLSAFQVDLQTKFGQMVRRIAIEVGENFQYSRWREYFSEGSCPLWTETVSQAIGEAMVLEPIMSGILVELGLRGEGGAATMTRTPDIAGPDAGIGGMIGGTILRSVEEAINDALLGPVTEIVANTLCEIRVGDIVGSLTGGFLGGGTVGDRVSDAYLSSLVDQA